MQAHKGSHRPSQSSMGASGSQGTILVLSDYTMPCDFVLCYTGGSPKQGAPVNPMNGSPEGFSSSSSANFRPVSGSPSTFSWKPALRKGRGQRQAEDLETLWWPFLSQPGKLKTFVCVPMQGFMGFQSESTKDSFRLAGNFGRQSIGLRPGSRWG